MSKNPNPNDIIAARSLVQDRDGVGITAAQDKCAEMLHTSRRAFQQWENGDRKMHPAFWELLTIKLDK
jgi:DNA-binding transcriptional regulator YiaG